MCTIAWPIHVQLSLQWKTRPRFRPVSLSLSLCQRRRKNILSDRRTRSINFPMLFRFPDFSVILFFVFYLFIFKLFRFFFVFRNTITLVFSRDLTKTPETRFDENESVSNRRRKRTESSKIGNSGSFSISILNIEHD